MLRVTAVNMGFGHVECGPLVRSSYHAHAQTSAFEATGRHDTHGHISDS
jgi:lipoate synthase